MLDVAQVFFPDARQLGTFQHFLVDDVNEVDACLGGLQALAVAYDVVALEEGFDDGGSCGGTSDAVFLQGVAQLLVLDGLAGCLHSAEQGGLGVGLGRLRPFLLKVGDVRAALALGEEGESALRGIVGVLRFFRILRVFRVSNHRAPARIEDGFAGGLEIDIACTAKYRGGSKETIGEEYGNEMACHEVEHFALYVAEVRGVDAGGDDGVVVGDL